MDNGTNPNEFNVLIVGAIHPSDAMDPDELRHWRPGSGKEDDRAITDHVLGALVRAGYSVIAVSERAYSLDALVLPVDTTTDEEWTADQEAFRISQALIARYPEFRPLVVSAAPHGTYGLADPVYPATLQPIGHVLDPASSEPATQARVVHEFDAVAEPRKEKAGKPATKVYGLDPLQTGQKYVAKGPSKQKIQIIGVGTDTIRIMGAGGVPRVITRRTLKRDYKLVPDKGPSRSKE